MTEGYLQILELEPGLYFTAKLAIRFNVSRTTITKWLRQCGDKAVAMGKGRNVMWRVKENSLNLGLVKTCDRCYEHIPVSRYERHRKLCRENGYDG